MAHPIAPANSFPSPGPPAIPFQSCPIAASLGCVGKKWTLNILRDIAFFPDATFSFILKNNPGLLSRTLSLRLKQLSEDDLVVKQTLAEDPRHPKYRLTEKGQQVWPILGSLLQFGVQNYADRVFQDQRPRDLEEVFPETNGILMGRFATAPPKRSRPSRAVS